VKPLKGTTKRLIYILFAGAASFLTASQLTVVDTDLLNAVVWPVLSVWVGVQLAVVAILAGDLPTIETTLMALLDAKATMTKPQRDVVRDRLHKPITEVRANVRIGIVALLVLAGVVAWASVDLPYVEWRANWIISKLQVVYGAAGLISFVVLFSVWDTVEALFALGTLKAFVNDFK
jgi:hypothetical protein